MSTIMFGMVQGRLTQSPPGYLQWFPQNSWQDEFNTAASIGVNYIELIAEVQHNPENPIWTDAGISKIKQLVKKNDLTLHALCNDYIVEHSFLDLGLGIDVSYFKIEYDDTLEGWKKDGAFKILNHPGEVSSQGIELVSKWKKSEMLNFMFNYTYSSTYDGADHDNENKTAIT